MRTSRQQAGGVQALQGRGVPLQVGAYLPVWAQWEGARYTGVVLRCGGGHRLLRLSYSQREPPSGARLKGAGRHAGPAALPAAAHLMSSHSQPHRLSRHRAGPSPRSAHVPTCSGVVARAVEPSHPHPVPGERSMLAERNAASL